MLVSEIHYRLEQNLQILNSFVYSNFEFQEINLQFDTIVNRYINSFFKPESPSSLKGEDEIQSDLDDLKFLKVVDYAITLTSGKGDLPIDYFYLLNDRSIVDICGVDTEVANRLMGDEDLFTTLQNPFTTSKPNSPISRIYGTSSGISKYRVYTKGFTVTTALIDYLRVPVSLYATFNIPSPPVDYDFIDFDTDVIEFLIDLTRNRLLEVVESTRLDKVIPETNNFNVI